MALVRIHAFVRPDPLRGLRVAMWLGQVEWPGAPREGDTWFHCEDWGGETVQRGAFNAPVVPGQPGYDMEVRTTLEVLEHLVAAHGFEGTWAGVASPGD